MENQWFWRTAVAIEPNRTEPNQKLHKSIGFIKKDDTVPAPPRINSKMIQF